MAKTRTGAGPRMKNEHAEREPQRTTLKEYRATSKASRYSLADSLVGLKEKLARQESEG